VTEGRRSLRAVVIRVGIAMFVVLAIAFFAFALVKAWNDTNGELPGIGYIAATVALTLVSLVAGAYAWGTLLGDGRKLDHGAALLVAQIGKYIPGAIWQATGQVGLAKSAGISVGRSATAFSVHALVQAVAGATYGLLLAVVWTDGNPFLRVLCAVGAIVSLVVLDRRWLVWALKKIPRTRDASEALVPDQRSIIIAWAMSLIVVGATSAAYVVMLASFGHLDSPWLVWAGYAVAWTIGFIAVPIPSGLGIREAVLAFILRGTFPASVLVAASVYQRLVTVATEGIAALAASHRVRPARMKAAATPEAPAAE
jgi:hypothetical protein